MCEIFSCLFESNRTEVFEEDTPSCCQSRVCAGLNAVVKVISILAEGIFKCIFCCLLPPNANRNRYQVKPNMYGKRGSSLTRRTGEASVKVRTGYTPVVGYSVSERAPIQIETRVPVQPVVDFYSRTRVPTQTGYRGSAVPVVNDRSSARVPIETGYRGSALPVVNDRSSARVPIETGYRGSAVPVVNDQSSARVPIQTEVRTQSRQISGNPGNGQRDRVQIGKS